jgi:hypothetical protein
MMVAPSLDETWELAASFECARSSLEIARPPIGIGPAENEARITATSGAHSWKVTFHSKIEEGF